MVSAVLVTDWPFSVASAWPRLLRVTAKRSCHIKWSQEAALPATTDPAWGLQFRFELPSSGPKPGRSLHENRNKLVQFKAVVSVPGFRKAVTLNNPPIARRWQLVVMAPMPGADYRASFHIPVGED